MSIKPQDCGLKAKKPLGLDWSCLQKFTVVSPVLPVLPAFQDLHLQQQQGRKPSLPEHTGMGGTAKNLCVYPAQLFTGFPAALSHLQHTWKNRLSFCCSSGFVLGRAAVLGLRRGRWRELKGSSVSSTHTAICYCEKPSVSRYYNPQRGNYS